MLEGNRPIQFIVRTFQTKKTLKNMKQNRSIHVRPNSIDLLFLRSFTDQLQQMVKMDRNTRRIRETTNRLSLA